MQVSFTKHHYTHTGTNIGEPPQEKNCDLPDWQYGRLLRFLEANDNIANGNFHYTKYFKGTKLDEHHLMVDGIGMIDDLPVDFSIETFEYRKGNVFTMMLDEKGDILGEFSYFPEDRKETPMFKTAVTFKKPVLANA